MFTRTTSFLCWKGAKSGWALLYNNKKQSHMTTYPNKNFMVDFKLFCCCSVSSSCDWSALSLSLPPPSHNFLPPGSKKHFSAFSNSCICVAPATSISIRSDRFRSMNMNSPFLCCSLLRCFILFTHSPTRFHSGSRSFHPLVHESLFQPTPKSFSVLFA